LGGRGHRYRHHRYKALKEKKWQGEYAQLEEHGEVRSKNWGLFLWAAWDFFFYVKFIVKGQGSARRSAGVVAGGDRKGQEGMVAKRFFGLGVPWVLSKSESKENRGALVAAGPILKVRGVKSGPGCFVFCCWGWENSSDLWASGWGDSISPGAQGKGNIWLGNSQDAQT